MLSIVLAVNRYFMSPSLLVRPITGGRLIWAVEYDFQDLSLVLSIVLSVLLIGAYLFGARREHNLYGIVSLTDRAGELTLPVQYHRVFQKAALISSTALFMSLAALSIMVFKPY